MTHTDSRGDTMNRALLITTKEAAAMLALNPRTVQALIRSGQLRSIKIGRSRRIPVEAIAELIAAQEL